MAEQDKDKDKATTRTRSAAPPDHTDPAAAATINRGDLDQTDPAAAALSKARDAAERKELEAELEKLRERLAAAGGKDVSLPVLRATVDAMRQAAARAGGAKRFAHMPAGVAADIERQGYAVDVDGSTYVREGEQVFRTQRGSGEREQVDMPVAPDSAAVLGVEAGRPSEKPAES